MTAYYVTTSGSDSNNGLTEGTAFATPGYAASQATTAGDLIYIKEGTYTISTSSSNVSNGVMSVTSGVNVEGYKTTAGDKAAKPLLTSTVTGTLTNNFMILMNNVDRGLGYYAYIDSVEVNGGSSGFSYGIQIGFHQIAAFNCKASSTYYGVTGKAYFCEAYSCTRGFANATCYGCYAQGCTDHGFHTCSVTNCIAYNNNNNAYFNNNFVHGFISHTSTYYGVNFVSNRDYAPPYKNLVVIDSGTYGLSGLVNGQPVFNFAGYNNASGNHQFSGSWLVNEITLTADPFTDPASGDWSLNSDAGGGELLKSVSQVMPFGTSYNDVSPLQRQVTAASSGGGSSTPTAGTQVYPFRQFVEDDFGGGSGGGSVIVIED